MERIFKLDENNPQDRLDALEIMFAEHLLAHRALRGAIKTIGKISVKPPQLDDNEVRLPHLVGVEMNDDISDMVVWEKLPRTDAERWFGGVLPDQQYIENHLADLLSLRRQLRHQEIGSAIPNELELSLAGRYLSILFVYQNFSLFHQIWDRSEIP